MTSRTSQANSQIATQPDGRALHDRPTGAILVIGIALTALLFAFGVRRLTGLQPLLLRTLVAGVIAYVLVSLVNNALAVPPWRRDRASCRPWRRPVSLTAAASS